jgi:hypothetical protein
MTTDQVAALLLVVGVQIASEASPRELKNHGTTAQGISILRDVSARTVIGPALLEIVACR